MDEGAAQRESCFSELRYRITPWFGSRRTVQPMLVHGHPLQETESWNC